MNKTLFSTLVAFLIYLANHIGGVMMKGSLSGEWKRNAFIIFMAVVILAFAADYFFNFRRKHRFLISKWTYLLLGLAIWLSIWNWLMVAINAGIMTLFWFWERKQKNY